MFLSCFAVFSLVAGSIFIGYMDYQVHSALGVYGINIQDSGWGYYVTPSGTWYHNFNVLESSMHEWIMLSVLFGIIIGSLGMLGILKLWNKKSECRNEVD